ncbi:MAG: hypothetical protein WCG10_00325 [Chlamydiota bacterium]
MKISRRSFTLLEIFLAISILAMVGGLLAFKAKDLLETYGFRQDVARLFGRLELARSFSLSYQADVEVIFYSKSGYILCELQSDEPALKHHTMFYKPLACKKIHEVKFSGEKESLNDKKTLIFSGSGWVFPLSSLEVSSHRQDKWKTNLGDFLKENRAK